MKRTLISSAAAVLCAGVFVAAQNPPTSPPTPRPQPQPRAEPSQTASMTMTGCVYNEKDVPGRSPNIAERAGILEDFILADVRMGTTSGSSSDRPATTGTTGSGAGGAAGTSGTSRTMYKLQEVDDEKLEGLVGKRVEVMGRVDPDSATAQGTTGRNEPGVTDRSADRTELPEFEVASIREIAGTCPATPAPATTPAPASTPNR